MNSSIFFFIQNSYPIFFNPTLSKSTAIEVPSIAIIVPIPNALCLTCLPTISSGITTGGFGSGFEITGGTYADLMPDFF